MEAGETLASHEPSLSKTRVRGLHFSEPTCTEPLPFLSSTSHRSSSTFSCRLASDLVGFLSEDPLVWTNPPEQFDDALARGEPRYLLNRAEAQQRSGWLLEHAAENSYSYVLNDPIKYADPTGWFAMGGCLVRRAQATADTGFNPETGKEDCGCKMRGTCQPGNHFITTFVSRPFGGRCPDFCVAAVPYNAPGRKPWLCFYKRQGL